MLSCRVGWYEFKRWMLVLLGMRYFISWINSMDKV